MSKKQQSQGDREMVEAPRSYPKARYIVLDGVEYELQKWPLRPGWKIGNRITMLGAEIVELLPDGEAFDLKSIDFTKIAGFIGDKNLELLEEILVQGIKDMRPDTVANDLSFEAALIALEAVLKDNLSFLVARFQNLRKSNEISTPPAQS